MGKVIYTGYHNFYDYKVYTDHGIVVFARKVILSDEKYLPVHYGKRCTEENFSGLCSYKEMMDFYRRGNLKFIKENEIRY